MPINSNDFSAVGTGREAITLPNQVAQDGDSEGVLLAKCLELLGEISGNTEPVTTPTFSAVTPQVLNPTGTASFTANSTSAVSAQPATGASQLSVNIGGAGAVTLPVGVGYNIDSGHPSIKNANSIVITCIAGQVVVTSRA